MPDDKRKFFIYLLLSLYWRTTEVSMRWVVTKEVRLDSENITILKG